MVRCSSGAKIGSPFFAVGAQNCSGSSTVSVTFSRNWSLRVTVCAG
jgi:hypothetical protein